MVCASHPAMATKVLLLLCGLLCLLLVGVALSGGSQTASQDADRALREGPAASSGGSFVAVGAIAAPGALQAASSVNSAGALASPAAWPTAAEAGPPPDHLPGTRPMSVPDAVGPFGCFHACGASCACAGRKDSTQTLNHGGRSCRYQVIQCNTHPFCVWHDQCYMDCDNTMPNALRRTGCYRQCDTGCVTGAAPWSNYPDPPGRYSLSDCIRWARHRDSAPATGTITYSQLSGCD